MSLCVLFRFVRFAIIDFFFKRNVVSFRVFLATWGSEISNWLVDVHVCIVDMVLAVLMFDVLAVICCLLLPSVREPRI
jgi:hypothetical protein